MILKEILAKHAQRPQGFHWDIRPKALERWNPGIQAADSKSNDIGIFDVIGQDYWGEGVTAKRISAALRSIGAENPAVVNINSPGGDLFEGLTIYELLQQHKGEVTVRVMGLAASAASVIAMAGDKIEISRAGFFMIHNSWALSIGDRHDHRAFADYLEPFDAAMADIYNTHTGLATDELATMMDRETWLGGQAAVDQSFADSLLSAGAVTETDAGRERAALREIDVLMAKAGAPRTKRRELFNQLKPSTHDAAGGGTPRATVTNTPGAVVLEAESLPRLTFPTS